MNGPGWTWVREATVLAVHDEQIAEHGGLPGTRDMGLVQSALARPQNLAAYGEADVASLAAAYAYGLARNHGFADGNKRTAFVVALLFLLANGWELIAADIEAIDIFLSLAAGEMTEEALAVWIRSNIRPDT